MSKKTQQPVMRLHLWLEQADGVLFGQGRLQLLEYIEQTGSINAAAKRLGMSYRAAWGKIKASEEALGFKLLEQPEGRRSGCRLSDAARMLMEGYRNWLEEVEAIALERAEKHLGYTPEQFLNRNGACALPAKSANPKPSQNPAKTSRQTIGATH